MGGRVASGTPVVTYTLIGICVVMFIGQLTIPNFTTDLLFHSWVGLHQPYRFLTAAFLHSTSFYGHILFNMYALYMAGRFLEPVLGRARFLALALLSAVGGSVGVLLLNQPQVVGGGVIAWGTGVVGASGMVFGLFGAMVAIMRHFGANYAQMLGVIAINGVIGFVVPGIAWQAHIGGLVIGFAIGWAFAHVPKERRKLAGWALPLVFTIALTAIVIARYALAPGGLAFWA
ncbi:MAG: rhomboid family intramembrane serine protease [Promicromonosporaceae bacterium]|nr:rhomboid family intramembrane serine protease [Promicromonosporaceae bacterium]